LNRSGCAFKSADDADYLENKVVAERSPGHTVLVPVLTLDDFGGRSDALGG
jgi:hypothetical protein